MSPSLPYLPPQTTFQEMGFSVYGGDDAPYIWVGFPGAHVSMTRLQPHCQTP